MGRKVTKERPPASPVLARMLEVMQTMGVKPSEVCKAIGVAPSTYSSWLQRGTPPGTEQLAKILQYMHADANYVMGVSDMTTDTLTERQREILKTVTQLTPVQAMYIQGEMLQMIAEQYLKKHPQEDHYSTDELSHLPVREGDF